MKKIINALFFTFTIILIGCNQNNNNQTTKSTLEQIISKKEMRVGYLAFNPCVIKNQKSGELTGIYIDMVNQIAKSLDTTMKVTWVETTLQNFSAGLNADKFDFCVGPTFVTIPRATAVAFTQPVNYVGNSGIISRTSKINFKNFLDFNKENITVAVLQGQALESYCKKNLPKAKLLSLQGGDLTAPLAAVSSGNADIGLINNITITQYAKAHNEVKVIFGGDDQFEILPLSWTTRKNDVELLNFLNSSIIYLKSTNRLRLYQQKYEIPLLYDLSPIQTLK